MYLDILFIQILIKQCRFVTKYCHKDGKILLKITDDNVVWIYNLY